MNKSALREDFLKKRLAKSIEQTEKAGVAIAVVLASEPVFKRAKKIALYHPIRGEVPTGEIEKLALKAGKIICLPQTLKAEKRMVFALAGGDMIEGPYGIPEPDEHAERVDIMALDMVIVPGLAFDRNGCRLGYGEGYYDRIFGDFKGDAALVGLAYSFQLVELLPAEEHDVKMHIIVTESGIKYRSLKGV